MRGDDELFRRNPAVLLAICITWSMLGASFVVAWIRRGSVGLVSKGGDHIYATYTREAQPVAFWSVVAVGIAMPVVVTLFGILHFRKHREK